MKNYLLYGVLSIFLPFMACNPITNRIDPGSVVDEDQLQLEVYTTTEGGNQIVMSNTTPGVGSYWDYIVNTSVRQRDTVLLPFLGEQTITFTGLCNGGVVTAKRTVRVEKIDHPLIPEWSYFAGTGIEGKTWGWDYTEMTDKIWGNGGYLYDSAPTWWGLTAAEVGKDFPGELTQTMTFDLNGGANLTKKSADGSVIQKGSFKFDLSKSKMNGYNTAIWSIGQLQLQDVTVLHGISADEKDIPVYKFDILVLNEDKLVLAYPSPGPYNACWYWMFKALH